MSWMTGVSSDRELQPTDAVILEIGSRFEGTCTLSPRFGSLMREWTCTNIQEMDASVWKEMFQVAKELSDALLGRRGAAGA